MDVTDAPPLDWRILNDETQVASAGGRIVAIAYTVQAADTTGRTWLEFCFLPVDEPLLVEVMFGVGPGAHPAWNDRWTRARRAAEWTYASRGRTDSQG